jgi:DNA-binding NtrC family response regulator
MSKKVILLVTEDILSEWVNILSASVEEEYIVKTCVPQEINNYRDPILILVDLASIEDSVRFIKDLHSTAPSIPIVAVTSFPDWREARDVLKAGAIDCLIQVYDVKQVKENIQEQLMKLPLNIY